MMYYLTISPVTRKGYGSNSPWGEAEWAIDPWPMRAKGLIALVSPNKSDRKSNNKVSKCKLKKDLFGNKTKEFRYSMTITNSPLVA